MSYNSIWIFLLILQAFVTSLPIQDRYDVSVISIDQQVKNILPEAPKYEDTPDSENEQVISVRITSSVAVGRGKEKLSYIPHKYEPEIKHPVSEISSAGEEYSRLNTRTDDISERTSDLPPNLMGANIEYIKQLHAKKDSKDHNTELIHPFQLMEYSQPNENESSLNETPTKLNDEDKEIPTARKVPSISDANQFHEHIENRGYQNTNVNAPMEIYMDGNNPTNLRNDSLFESSSGKFGLRININDNKNVNNKTDKIRDINSFVSRNDNFQTEDSIAESSIKSVEFAKTTATLPSSASYIHDLANRQKQNNPRLTTVSFNIVHDSIKSNNNERSESYITTSQIVPNQQFYDRPHTYSAPAQIYSEPSKFYSEPAKVYSEPAKIYSEPSKVYSEPAKIYSEPAKFYSEPASLHLNQNVPPSAPPNYSPWQRQPSLPIGGTTINTTPITAITNTYQTGSTQMEHQPERNYEVDEKISVLTDGRSHGVQESATEKCKQDNCKVGYVVEGRQYKKYRVEERTPDGFIVGEYGVVRNEDGALRGVRYTADSDASPRLIHDALMKFLQLQ